MVAATRSRLTCFGYCRTQSNAQHPHDMKHIRTERPSHRLAQPERTSPDPITKCFTSCIKALKVSEWQYS